MENTLKKVIKQLDTSQKHFLCSTLVISLQQLNNILSGRSRMTLDQFVIICETLNYSVLLIPREILKENDLTSGK